MKKVILKIKAVLLAIVLLVASNTYAITSHFCGNHLVDVSYLGKNKACGMESMEDDCSSAPKFEKNCCSEFTQLIESDLDTKTPDIESHKVRIDFLVAYVHTHIDFFSNTLVDYEYPREHSPPDVEQDYQVLYETFLI